MRYEETGEEMVLVQVRNDGGQPEGAPMYLTWTDIDTLDDQLPDGWCTEVRMR
jgi:hypothetical protein